MSKTPTDQELRVIYRYLKNSGKCRYDYDELKRLDSQGRFLISSSDYQEIKSASEAFQKKFLNIAAFQLVRSSKTLNWHLYLELDDIEEHENIYVDGYDLTKKYIYNLDEMLSFLENFNIKVIPTNIHADIRGKYIPREEPDGYAKSTKDGIGFELHLNKMSECDCGGGDAAPCGDSSACAGGISTGDVLGNCDHSSQSTSGYLGSDCFHIPSKVTPTLRRFDLCYGGSKRKGKKKTPYEKNIKVFGKLKENEIKKIYSRKQIKEAIAYWKKQLNESLGTMTIDNLIKKLEIIKARSGGDTTILDIAKNENGNAELIYSIGPGTYKGISLDIPFPRV